MGKAEQVLPGGVACRAEAVALQPRVFAALTPVLPSESSSRVLKMSARSSAYTAEVDSREKRLHSNPGEGKFWVLCVFQEEEFLIWKLDIFLLLSEVLGSCNSPFLSRCYDCKEYWLPCIVHKEYCLTFTFASVPFFSKAFARTAFMSV